MPLTATRRIIFLTLMFATGAAWAQRTASTSPAPVRLRGIVESFDAPILTLRERGGERLRVTLAPNLTFQEVVPIDIAAIQPGAFVGTAAVTRPDGSLESLEVVVFPESARGTCEGHYPWDLQRDSTMTNATVADLVCTGAGRQLTLRYKDGEKTVVVPDGVPVVTFKPAHTALIRPGAKVFIVAALRDGVPTATRLVIGRDGFAPPM